MYKMWHLEDIDENKIDNYTSDNLNPVFKKILFRRGLRTEKEINQFLNGGLEDLHEPFMLKDMEEAVDKIIKKRDKQIIVYGDYDVDGITGTSLLFNYFKKRVGIDIDYYIPDRQKEGYGLNLTAVKNIVNEDYDLLITVDCGITAIKEIEYAAAHGLDVIVTDHHQPAAELPPASAIINPHRKDENYPFSELAGVGVAFKLCTALEKRLQGKYISSLLLDELDLVALGSVADIVPLKGENRILIKEGMKTIVNSKKPGLQALIHKLSLEDSQLNTGHIGYILAPPLNAAGRMEDAKMGIRLFITSDKKEAEEIADKLVALNKERQKEEQETLETAEAMIADKIDLETEKGIVLASDEWHQGVIGIVASRIVEKYYRPTILISLKGNTGKGSCRSINKLNLYQALRACEYDLESFGGHEQAAGLTIAREKVDRFRKDLNSHLHKVLDEQDLIPRLRLDELIETEDINLELYKNLELLKPFGVGNPRPRFLINNAQIDKCYCVGNDNQHLKLLLNDGIEGIAFGFGELFGKLKNQFTGKEIDLAFAISLNSWQGQERIQLKIKDINIRSHVDFYPVNYKSGNWIIADKRGNKNHFNYLKYLLKYDEKVAVYINNKKIYNSLLDRCKDKDIAVNGQEKISLFKEKDKGILFFSRPEFKEKLSIDVLVLISLPFSLEEVTTMIEEFTLNPIKIHFLFGEEDYYTNRKIIKNKLPTTAYLRKFYLKLKSFCNQEIALNKIYGQLENEELKTNKKLVNTSLTIFNELGLIDKNQSSIKLVQTPGGKLDLSYSMRYNEINNVVEKFNEISRLVFADDIFALIYKLKQMFRGVE